MGTQMKKQYVLVEVLECVCAEEQKVKEGDLSFWEYGVTDSGALDKIWLYFKIGNQ